MTNQVLITTNTSPIWTVTASTTAYTTTLYFSNSTDITYPPSGHATTNITLDPNFLPIPKKKKKHIEKTLRKMGR